MLVTFQETAADRTVHFRVWVMNYPTGIILNGKIFLFIKNDWIERLVDASQTALKLSKGEIIPK